MTMRLTNKGFSPAGTLLAIVVIIAIGAGGWAVYHHEHKSAVKQTSTNNKVAGKAKPTTNTPSNKPSSSQTPTPSPILGEPWAATQQGYGTVKPATINNGGDPTGIITNITWQSWGGSQATGQGISTYVAPNDTVSEGTQEQATVVAFKLGTCQGKTAYTAVEWYFPQYSGSFNPNEYRNICTGQEVGD